MIVLILLCYFTTSFSSALPSIEDSIILSMVPRGQVLDKSGREIEVKTHAGTKIKIEFFRNGRLQEASGKNLNKGDIFEPGLGLITLSSAARNLPSPVKASSLSWNLEKDPKKGWVYEFLSITEEKSEFFAVNASTGNLLKD